jgi:hypothetical protein
LLSICAVEASYKLCDCKQQNKNRLRKKGGIDDTAYKKGGYDQRQKEKAWVCKRRFDKERKANTRASIMASSDKIRLPENSRIVQPNYLTKSTSRVRTFFSKLSIYMHARRSRTSGTLTEFFTGHSFAL